MANEFKIKKGLIVTGASSGTVVDIQGSQGQLFSVTDDLSGSIFAVSDISGVPILDVNSSGVSYFDGSLGIGTDNPTRQLEVVSSGGIVTVLTSTTGGSYISMEDSTTTSDSQVRFGAIGNNAIIKSGGTTALTLANNQNANFAGDVTVSGGDLNVGNSSTVNSVINMLGTNDSFIEKDTGNHLYFANNVGDKDIKFRIKDDTTNVIALTIDGSEGGDATFVAQAFSAATSSGDASSTLTTKGYVDGLITGATIYRGAWDPSGGGYGSPDLSGVTQTSGYYYICSAAGTAEPNGTGTEPDTWAVGDWVIYNDVSGTGQWQKIDNSSVLSGVGTGQTVALWEGASSVTDSETLGNAPITVSGNDTTFAGTVSGTTGTFTGNLAVGNTSAAEIYLNRNSANYINASNASGYLVFRTGGTGTALTLDASQNATFAGVLTVGNSGTSRFTDTSALPLQLNRGLAVDVVGTNGVALGLGSYTTGTTYVDAARIAANLEYNGTTASGDLFLQVNNSGTYSNALIINNDTNATFAGTVTSPTFLGDLNGTINTATTGVTQTAGDNSTLIATTAYADAAAAAVPIGNYLPLAGGTMTGVTQFNDHTNYGDQVYARFGASQDLQIFHNGTDSFIDNYTGSLTIRNRQDDGNIVFTCDDGSGGLASYLTLNGNSTHAYFTNPGNVGIGTTNPSSKLHIKGSDPILLIQDDSTGTAQASSTLRLGESGAGGVLDVYWDIKQAADDLNTHLEINHSSNGNHLTILDNGNVGIGTTLPIGKFNVSKDSTTDGLSQAITVSSSSVNSKRMNLGYVPGSNYAFIDVINYAISNTNQALSLQPNGGNVGIGATSPGAKLDVNGDVLIKSGEYISWGTVGATSIEGSTASNKLQFRTNSSDRMIIDSTGRVGIGTTSPDADFVVSHQGTSGIEIEANFQMGVNNILSFDRTVGALAYETMRLSANDYWFTTLGIERMRINSTGNVGIGTTSPSAEETNNGVPRLQVTTATAPLGEFPLAARFTTASDAGDNSGVSVLINSGNDRGLMISAGRAVSNRSRATLNLVQYDGNELVDGITLYQPNSASAGATTGTNVGIGTTSPSAKLEVNGQTVINSTGLTEGFQWFNDTNEIFSLEETSGAGELLLLSSNSVKVKLNANGNSYFNGGNVGIGTTSPSAKLDIYGDSNSSDNMLELSNSKYDSTDTTGETGILFGWNNHVAARIAAFKEGTINRTGFKIIGEAGFNTPTTIATFRSTGNVGIGTTSPQAPLSFANVVGNKIDFYYDTTNSDRYGIQVQSSELRIHSGAAGGSTGGITFGKDNGTTFTERMRITNGGNVGIGTTSPSSKLHVAGNSTFIGGNEVTTNLYIHATNTAGAPARTACINMKGYEGRAIGTFFKDSSFDPDSSGVASEWFAGLNYAGNFTKYSIGFDGTDGTPVPELLSAAKLTVTNLGNVGIGTSDPDSKLEVIGNGGTVLDIQGTQGQLFSVTDDLSGDIFSVADISGVPIMSVNSDGTSYFDGRLRIEGPAPIATQPMLELHRTSPVVDYKDLNYAGYFSLKERFLNSGSTVIGSREVSQNPGGSGIYHNFDNGASGGSQFHQKQNSFHWKINSTSEKLTLGTNGYLGINDTSPSYQLDVNGSGRFTSTVTATNFINSSDERLKENIEELGNNNVEVNWKTFNFKTEKEQKRYGVIAQELEKTNPEFVREDSKGFKSVAYIDLLIAKIAELEARIQKLEK